jgi:phosphopantothenoylcysteine synthetase/decarboxylase
MTLKANVLYVVICGVDRASDSYGFITDAMNDGWQVCALPTPSGSEFVDVGRLASLTGYPVRTKFKSPSEADILPPADAFVVAPASFNTVNKIANGIADTLPVGIICEAVGKRQPVVLAPWMNRALVGHSAYSRSLKYLTDDGVEIVLTDRTRPGGSLDDPGGKFPWEAVLTHVRRLKV